jgi:hypothetical protein
MKVKKQYLIHSMMLGEELMLDCHGIVMSKKLFTQIALSQTINLIKTCVTEKVFTQFPL